MSGAGPLDALERPDAAELEVADEALTALERQRAVRLLLGHPFVTDAVPDPQAFALVRRHQHWLQRFFADQLGYRLVVDVEFARLHKRPAPGARPRPARSRTGAAFDRRRYALLCLVLAALERVELQTVLSELAEEVRLLAAAEEGIEPFDLERYAERQSFVDAVRWLVALGVLRLTDGDDRAFVEGRGDALYDVDARQLTQLIASPVPPSLADGPDALDAETYPPTLEGTNRRIRHRLMRRLLEEPVVYLADLDVTERAYLASQRHYLLEQARAATGLPVEVRQEGLALIDDGGRMSDFAFPGTSSVDQAALRLAERLGERTAETSTSKTEGAGGETEAGASSWIPSSLLLGDVEALLDEHGRGWSKRYREQAAGAERLLEDALERLEALALVERRPGAARPRPAVARYAVEDPEEVDLGDL